MIDEATIAIGLLVGIIFFGIASELLFEKFRIPEQIILLLIGVAVRYANLIPNESSTLAYLDSIAPTLGTMCSAPFYWTQDWACA